MHLVGWTGASRKHLQKYADAWQALPGAPAATLLEVSHCRMGVTEPWSTIKFERLADELHERLAAAPSACKLVLHIFSNGGGTLWAALARRMRAAQRGGCQSIQLAGLIFDSCPGSFRSLSSGFNFLWASQRSSLVRGGLLVCAPLIVLAGAIVWLWSLRCNDGGVSDLQARYAHDFLLYVRELHDAAAPRLPILFLYSADDALIPPHAVKACVAAHRALAHCDVCAKRWERSVHVSHLRTDPEGYKTACAEVLSKL